MRRGGTPRAPAARPEMSAPHRGARPLTSPRFVVAAGSRRTHGSSLSGASKPPRTGADMEVGSADISLLDVGGRDPLPCSTGRPRAARRDHGLDGHPGLDAPE